MSQNPTLSTDLGTLSILPLEIRETIYNHALNQLPPLALPPSSQHHTPKPRIATRTSLLRTSKRIHDESAKILINTSRFLITLDPVINDSEGGNRSIDGVSGWIWNLGSIKLDSRPRNRGQVIFADEQRSAWVVKDLIKEIRDVEIYVGAADPIRMLDVGPFSMLREFQRQPASFHSLDQVLDLVVEILGRCNRLKELRVRVRSEDVEQESIWSVLEKFGDVRGVDEVTVMVYGTKGHRKWDISGEYAEYWEKIMMLQEGAEIPEFVGEMFVYGSRVPSNWMELHWAATDPFVSGESDDETFDSFGNW